MTQEWPPTEYAAGAFAAPQQASVATFVPTLKLRTYEALRATIDSERLTLRQIAEGADVGYHWLRQFSADKIDGPAVDSIEKLYFFLTGRRL